MQLQENLQNSVLLDSKISKFIKAAESQIRSTMIPSLAQSGHIGLKTLVIHAIVLVMLALDRMQTNVLFVQQILIDTMTALAKVHAQVLLIHQA